MYFTFLSRFSKGRRSNLRGSSVKSLQLIAEETVPEASTSETSTTTQPKRTTRKNKQTKSDVDKDVRQSLGGSSETEKVQNEEPELVKEDQVDNSNGMEGKEMKTDDPRGTTQTPPKIPSPEVVVTISPSDRLSAELVKKPEPSPGRGATKIEIAGVEKSARRSSVRCSLKLRHSLAGLRHSMTQESVRRASHRSMLKRKATRMGNSTCSSNVGGEKVAAFSGCYVVCVCV